MIDKKTLDWWDNLNAEESIRVAKRVLSKALEKGSLTGGNNENNN